MNVRYAEGTVYFVDSGAQRNVKGWSSAFDCSWRLRHFDWLRSDTAKTGTGHPKLTG